VLCSLKENAKMNFETKKESEITVVRYDKGIVRCLVDIHRDRLFAAYAEGKPKSWCCDQRTKDAVCIANWIDGELRRLGIDDLGRRTQTAQFNRRHRTEEDMWTVAAEIMNEALNDNIDRFRKPHRRWG
jgi:hypothetical protein